MILGTSAYKNGARATTFRPKIDAGLGYLKGEENTPQVVRTYYLNNADTERAAKRARAIREAAGTLSGVALGEDDSTPQRDVLADVLEAFGMRSRAPLGRARRAPRRAVPRAVGRHQRRRRVRRAARPRRAVRGRHRGGRARPRLPPRGRPGRGRPAVTRYRGNAAVAAPDQREHYPAVAGVAAPPALTCAATGNGPGREIERRASPMGGAARTRKSTVTSSAPTPTAPASPARCTSRVSATVTSAASTRATRRASRTATPRASTPGTSRALPMASTPARARIRTDR